MNRHALGENPLTRHRDSILRNTDFDYAPKSTGSIEYGGLVEEVIQHESTCPRRKSTHETSR